MSGDRLVTPDQYASGLQAPLVASSETAGWRSALVRRWKGGSGQISQPPIDHHYLVLHLGGSKHVTRIGGGRTMSASVGEGALTLVPAGACYDWVTVGPIDFAHLYIHPSRLDGLIASTYDRDPAVVTLDEQVGFTDPLLSQTLREMLAQVGEASTEAHAYLDALFDSALAQLARKHSTLGPVTRAARHALAPVRLRRVIDYVEAHLADPISASDLAHVAGLSRFHFGRAFQNATGDTPSAYLVRRRLELAKRLLRLSDLPHAEIARRAGLGAASQFAAVFRRHVGQTPSDYRRHL
jgi:AraC family transcriptional regulator